MRTVCEEVERALAVVLRVPSVSLTVAGRTDAGVHAWGQVASYAGPPVAVRSVNAVLPSDVAALDCCEALPGFDARRDATSRAYCYRVLARGPRSAFERGRALYWPHRSRPVGPARVCRRAWSGSTTSRRSRRPTPSTCGSPARCSRRTWRGPGDGVLEFWIEADAFMRQMIRVVVGTMLEVGGGRRSVASFSELLSGRPRSCAGRTAPAHGLYLAGVGYGGERVLYV